MKATLGLEFIGADTWDQIRGMSRMIDQVVDGLGRRVVGQGQSGPWVAEITGRDPRYGMSRRFLTPKRDYSRANSRGSRGVYLWFVLETDRLYEVHERQSWSSSRRYFCAVTEGGHIYELSDDEVQAWLNEA